MKKTPTKNGAVTVTFEIPEAIGAERAVLCGDFNDWSTDTHPMRRRKDGTFATTVCLNPGEYQFKYLIDEERWVNDWAADRYDRNEFGDDNSVVVV